MSNLFKKSFKTERIFSKKQESSFTFQNYEAIRRNKELKCFIPTVGKI